MARMPKTMLNRVYIKKLAMSPDFNKEWFSKANVEKVVKPPQKPVASNKV